MTEICHIELSELQSALADIFATYHHKRGPIIRLDRETLPYKSSFPLEALTIGFDNGESLKLVFKNLNPGTLSVAARAAKPKFLDDPLREIELYRNLLDSRQLGTPFYYGSVIDESAERYWLFLEKINGRELYQIGEDEIWGHAARWLARFHCRYRNTDNLSPKVRARLIRYDAAYYARWMERATSYLEHRSNGTPTIGQQLWQQLSDWYPKCVRELASLTTTLIHGEFYPSNVIVQGTLPEIRVCPVDWERAAVGPGLIDLAALVGGNWTELQKREFARRYFEELHSCNIEVPQWESFLRELHLCRLHLAVQWLGWSKDWSPPREHQQDWQAEAFYNAQILGFPSAPDVEDLA